MIEANAFREKKELKVTPKSWIRAGKYCKTQFFNSLRTADAKYENVKMYLISAMLAYLTADAKNKLLYLDIELRMLGLQKEVEDLEDLLAKKYGVDWAFKCDEARDNY